MDTTRTESCNISCSSDLKEIFDYVRYKESAEKSYIEKIDEQSRLIDTYKNRITDMEYIESEYERCCKALDIISHIIKREETMKSNVPKLVKEIKQVLNEIS